MLNIGIVGCSSWSKIIIKEINNIKKFKLTSIVCRNKKKKQKKIKNFYSIRPSYIYGHNQRKGTLIDLLLKSIKKNKKLNMSHCKLYRDYIFVDDVAKAFLNVTKRNGDKGIYNVGSGKVITLRKLILTIAKKAQFPKKLLNFGKLPKKKEQQHPKCFMDTKKLKSNFGWKVNYNLDNGVERILKKNYIKHN